MKSFEIIEHTADTGIRAFGSDLKQVFVNAAEGMFSIMVDPSSVDEHQEEKITVEADGLDELLVEWLNELLYLSEVNRMLFKRFIVDKMTETSLEARAFGEPIDDSKHELRSDIKAVTYHMLKVEQKNGIWTAQVIFDV